MPEDCDRACCGICAGGVPEGAMRWTSGTWQPDRTGLPGDTVTADAPWRDPGD